MKEAGIPVVNFDTAVSNLDLVGSYVATDNYQAGVQCAEAMIKDLPDGGEIAVLDYPAMIERKVFWIQLMEKGLM